MPPCAQPPIFIDKIYAFNHGCEEIWSTNESAPEDATIAVVIIDISYSMSPHKKALAMAVAAMLEGTNVDKIFAVPKPDGQTAMVQAIEQIMCDGGENMGKTVYLIGDGDENMKKGTLSIGQDDQQNTLQSMPLDFTMYNMPASERARHYRALVDFLKFQRITLVMLALGDTVKDLLNGLSNTKNIYLAHLDYEEDIDNMMHIAQLVKKEASKGIIQTTLIQVDEQDKKKSSKAKVTTQTQQKLKKILGNITVGDKIPGTVEDLQNDMDRILDDYIAKDGIPCVKEHRLYINAQLLFLFSKCTDKQAVPAVIISGKNKNRLVEFPLGCNDGQYSKCLNQLCGKFANANVVLQKHGDTTDDGFTIDHLGSSRKFGPKCAQYSCLYQLSVVEELAGNETFCVARDLIQMPVRIVGKKSKTPSP